MEHSSHAHPLILNEECSDLATLCDGCIEPISTSAPNYSCNPCNYHLRQSCAELAPKIQSLFHTKHPLIRSSSSETGDTDSITCNLCDKSCDPGFFYSCSSCYFHIHTKCAFPSCLYGDQKHQFMPLLNTHPLGSKGFDCNACGEIGSKHDFSYVCANCQIVVHRACSRLPLSINIRQHPHPITKTYCFLKDDVDSLLPSCGICEKNLKEYGGGYGCPEAGCNFHAHIRCALQFVTTDHDPTPNPKTGEEEKIMEVKVKHFSHEHDLFLTDKIAYKGHEHPLTLQSPTIEDEVFLCSICFQPNQGLFYRCDQCDITTDIRCIKLALEGSIKHESHEHPLFVAKYDPEIPSLPLFSGCKACGRRKNPNVMGEFLRCGICRFDLHFGCASLPSKVIKDRYDEHPLFLTYKPLDQGCEEYYCRICEIERNNEEQWFYYCEKCDFDAHPRCILGLCHNLKLGKTYIFQEIHPHPITLKEWMDRPGPSCHQCHQPCDGTVYECSRSDECDFVIHAYRKCSQISGY
ncbi:hypothetical protein Tsubulata_029427 [Turnera subulata]|uniref:Zinc finger PHD-type domain-containing protein n=1 Tax=Turnera subulata TaxID=218843 RepID=A0A9Q0GMN6_9ROSI|nr:hypothetical protein Tsubulata_029427 [Turnera subulata]